MNIPSLRKNLGVTLVELLIAIAIIGILVGLVGPNYTPLVAKITVATETRRTIGILKQARSEARARGATVTLRRPEPGDWSGAVRVYESMTVSGNADFDDTVAENAATGDDLITDYPASKRSVTINDNDTSSGARYISFNMQGWLSSGENGNILLAVCSPVLDASEGMYIEINRVGKIRERAIDNDSRECL